VTSAFSPRQFPEWTFPEIAFAGRSNVGKSSLMNALMGRSGLVKVSSRPGFTRSINFFLVNDAFSFVDLPGYGFAKVPKGIRESWKVLIETYIEKRANLHGVVCIFDIRRDPDGLDRGLIDYLTAAGRRVWIVLNKADKIPQPKRRAVEQNVLAKLGARGEEAILVSARTGAGIDILSDTIWERLGSSTFCVD